MNPTRPWSRQRPVPRATSRAHAIPSATVVPNRLQWPPRIGIDSARAATKGAWPFRPEAGSGRRLSGAVARRSTIAVGLLGIERRRCREDLGLPQEVRENLSHHAMAARSRVEASVERIVGERARIDAAGLEQRAEVGSNRVFQARRF